MQEVAAIRFPSGSSLALAPVDLHANNARLSRGISEKNLKSSGFPFSGVSAPSGIPAFPEPCDNGNTWNGGASEGLPPRMRSQSSILRVSQSVRWTKTGVVVERHVASAQVVTASSEAAEQRCEWKGLVESRFQQGFSSSVAAVAAKRSTAAASPPQWGPPTAALLPAKGSKPASPIAASPAAAAARAAWASTSSPPAPQTQALQYVRRLEVVEGGRCSLPSSGSLLFQKGESAASNDIGAFSTRQPVAALKGAPFLGGAEGKEFFSSTEDSDSAEERERLSPSSGVRVSRQQSLRPSTGPVSTPQEPEQLRASSLLQVFQPALRDKPVSPKRSLSRAESGQKRTSGSLARYRSAGQSVDVSGVRTVKGPRSRSEQIEREPAEQRGRKVTVRPRRQRRSSADLSSLDADGNVSLPLFKPTDAKGGMYSSAWKLEEEEMNEPRTFSTRKGNARRSASVQPASSRAVSFSSQPLNRRPMSTTEAYFGRVPGASADFQRLLGFRGQEGPLSSAASASAGLRKGGSERISDQPAFTESFTKLKQERAPSVANGGLPDKVKEAQVTQQPRSSEYQVESQEGKKKGSSSKWRKPPTPLLKQTEAASAVRALAAAQASAEAAAAARAANAGPLPAWRRQQQIESLGTNGKAFHNRQSTLRKSLSLPLTFFAKVKAKFSRSKSAN
ncbi:hypothetical protein Emed_005655 [Eimeria media]